MQERERTPSRRGTSIMVTDTKPRGVMHYVLHWSCTQHAVAVWRNWLTHTRARTRSHRYTLTCTRNAHSHAHSHVHMHSHTGTHSPIHAPTHCPRASQKLLLAEALQARCDLDGPGQATRFSSCTWSCPFSGRGRCFGTGAGVLAPCS